jgi:hypothetical protein
MPSSNMTGRDIRDENGGRRQIEVMSGMGRRRRNLIEVIYILWLRQLKHYWRSKSRLIGSLGQPLLFMVAFGFGFGPCIRKRAEEENYLDFLAPGLYRCQFSLQRIFFRTGSYLGQAVWFSQRNPCGTYFKDGNNGRKNTWRSNHSNDPGPDRAVA